MVEKKTVPLHWSLCPSFHILLITIKIIFVFYYTKGEDQESMMLLLPLFHVAGIVGSMLAGLQVGAKCLAIPQFNPNNFVSTLSNHKVCLILINL